jgi:hypothetical protein
MRYLTAACPPFAGVILVESGSRAVLDAAVPRLRGVLGTGIAFHLVTCRPGAPLSLGPNPSVWRTQDHAAPDERARMVRELTATGATVLAMICSGEPIMTRWKWWLAWQLPAKVLIVNENADCFWLDSTNLAMLQRLAFVRLGFAAGFPAKTAARLAMAPLVFVFLLIYAAAVHLRRALRLALAPRL